MTADNLPAVTGQAPARQDRSLVAAFDAALLALDDRLPELVGRPDVQVQVHQQLADLRRNIAVVIDRLEDMLLAELPTRVNRRGRVVPDRLVIDGVGVVEPAPKGSKWTDVDYPRMIQTVIKEQWEAGEIGHPGDVVRILSEIVTFAGIRSDSRKGTGLFGYGHDRAEFGTYVPGEPGVRIIPNEVTP